ncbi:beta-ketoacyl synthase N-terminal-like domain-containing protein [Nostoc sp. ChiVER01]|uniref:beta-ketoacyl synthase N-terminal-like domain-containing protein n=1 Tax=Nostoc sp. ChiVER01 TaxID=3075382 RepID=UPI002AD49EAF|nr:beta-ketoacyl synthase N-terminal-like domain-containing protein [Nostoc sp. ChiVER01]MDZ8227267.1 beta-ketoacyl synthase N-terminal-like domain-containing protein [Nostoc sp. ChiVER01]
MSSTSESINQLSPLQRAALALKEMRSKLDAIEKSQSEPIAIVGMGCRFPGAKDIESFWQVLRDGVDATTEVPASRWDTDAFYDPNPETPGKMYVRRGGFLDGVEEFDAEFFGISPREAISLDPQQRLLLEVGWEALENAAQAPEKLNGSLTGVFVGMCNNDYVQLEAFSAPSNIDVYTATGSINFGVGAGRLAYILGLHGPTLTVDTSCSSSLVTVHLACQSLRSGECNLALAGGVNLMLSPITTIAMSKVKALAADGRCKTFDAAADGYGRGEGCGMIVLKRLSDAVADGDRILALIPGTAINHDGCSSGLTVPNSLSQQKVIRAALKNAKIEPTEISYVEVHGTGTALGDPIEIQTLKAVFAKERTAAQPLMIGSAKTNIGHLEPAAGIAGLIKVVLAMQHQKIPAHLHFKQLNPHISLTGTCLKIPTEQTPWSVAAGQRRLAGVSAFGMSGTNAHVIVEEAPVRELERSLVKRPIHLLALSAKSETGLKELTTRITNYLTANPTESLADICFTANTGRSHFEHRLAIVADSLSSLHQQLEASGVDEYSVKSEHPHNRKIAFLFTGQGSQYINMARELYQTQPTFRACIDQCEQILRPYLETSLLDVLYPSETANAKLDQTAYTQPALFAVEYALAQLWQSWGIRPTIVMGHSVGEYVAACIAGVFSLEDGLKLIAERGRLMQALPSGGEMVAVFGSEAQVLAAVESGQQIAIAAVNTPGNVVISGESADIRSLVSKLEASGVETRQLKVSHAFHSSLMEPMLDDFERIAAEVTYSHPKISLVSNVTGQLAEGEIVASADYWCCHIRQTVRFAANMQTLHEQDCEIFVEIGPNTTLIGMGKQCLPQGVGIWLPSLRKGQQDWQVLLQSLCTLYAQGQEVDWVGFDCDYRRYRLSLPTYPFERQRYWTKAVKLQPQESLPSLPEIAHPFLGKRLQSPLQQIQFESLFSIDSLPLVRDHQAYGIPLVNFVIYLEMVFAGVVEAFGTKPCVLEDIFIFQALLLPEKVARTVQLILSEDSGKLSFQIFSLTNEQTAWTLHAAGKVVIAKTKIAASSRKCISLEKVQAQYDKEISRTEFYQIMAERGIFLGTSCQALERIWVGNGRALGEIQLPQTAELFDNRYHLPLASMDALFQIAIPYLTNQPHNYLLSGCENLQFYGYSGNRLWCEAIVRLGDGQENYQETVSADIHLFDETGQLVAEVVNTQLKRVSHEIIQRATEAGKKTSFNPTATQQIKKNSLSREKLLAVELGKRQQMLEIYLLEGLASSLQLPLAKLNPQQPLASLVDSLMIFELKRRIEADLQVRVPMEKFFGENTIAHLAELLLEQITLANLILSNPSSTDSSANMEEISL